MNLYFILARKFVQANLICTFPFSNDFLNVYDGNTTDSEQLITKETGIILPSDIKSSSTDMIVEFTTDHFYGRRGFIAELSFLRKGNCHIILVSFLLIEY